MTLREFFMALAHSPELMEAYAEGFPIPKEEDRGPIILQKGGGGVSKEYEAMIARQNEEAAAEKKRTEALEQQQKLTAEERKKRQSQSFLTSEGGSGQSVSNAIKSYLGAS